MREETKGIVALTAVTLGIFLCGATELQRCKEPEPVKCYRYLCQPCLCLGPENELANAPVRPRTCDGDFSLTASALYWYVEQSGLEYAVENSVLNADPVPGQPQTNNLIDSTYHSPNFEWNAGYKIGIGYSSFCDGWDVSALWTHYRERLNDNLSAKSTDNKTLHPLWSAFQPANAGQVPVLFATDIGANWHIDLNLLDFELGREFWTSRRTTLRPYIGLRGARLDQELHLRHKGGSYNDTGSSTSYNNQVKLDNNFRGVGVRTGLDTSYHIGCGWGFYGGASASILYGKFWIDHTERLREANSPFSKIDILDTKEAFRASRAALDLQLGLQYETLVCNCKYGLGLSLGWEQHYFFNQNQLWRVARKLGSDTSSILNSTGENVFRQKKGNLGSQGWTLTGRFSF